MMNEDYSDVTLVTEDKKQIKANISILSACSPIFRDILKKEKNCSTIMFLRGVQHSEIESILQFIYLGEDTFYGLWKYVLLDYILSPKCPCYFSKMEIFQLSRTRKNIC